MVSAILQFIPFFLLFCGVGYFIYRQAKKGGELNDVQNAANKVKADVQDITKKL